MLGIPFLIVLNFFVKRILKNNQKLIDKKNKEFIEKKEYNKIKDYNIIPRLILFNILFLIIWLGISFFVNKWLFKDFDESLDKGLLRYNIIKTESLVELEEDNDSEKETFLYAYKDEYKDKEEIRCYQYVTETGIKYKGIADAIKVNVIENGQNYIAEGNLIYDRFLKLIFFQFYSYQYKQIYCKEQNINYNTQ